jgi:hypothetical protein
MKKILSVALIIMLAIGMGFASDVFRPTSARIEAMGGAGIATATGADAFFMNPANLGAGTFSMNLPSVSLTLFNPKAIIDSGIIEDIQAGGSDPGMVAASVATKYLGIVKAGKGDILTTDIAASFTGGGLGFGVQLQEQLHTTSSDGSFGADKVIAEFNLAGTVGLGFRLDLIPGFLSVDAGASARFTYRAYTNEIGLSSAINLAQSSDDVGYALMRDTMLAAGWGIPIDAGVNVNLPFGLRASAVARNLNSVFTMQNYSELGAWVNEMAELADYEPVYTDLDPQATVTPFTYEIPWTLDVGLGWTPDLGSLSALLRPSLAIDLVDFLGYLENTDDLWTRLNIGAEVRVLNMIDIRAGLNKGYKSVGVGLDLLLVHIDASYYWREYGVAIGDKPIDALTVRVNIGVDGR